MTSFGVGRRSFASYCPVTANHAVAVGPTKMIGAKHGLGRLTVVWIIESPVVDAGKGSVATFAVAAAPSTMVRQLTTAGTT